MSETFVKRRRRVWRLLLLAVAVLALIAAGSVMFWRYLPYQGAAARQVRNILVSYGLAVKSLAVEKLTGTEADLRDIELGMEDVFKAKKLSLTYSLQELRERKIREVTAEGVEIQLVKTPEGWKVGGIQPLFSSSENKTSDYSLLTDKSKLQQILPSHVQLREGMLRIKGPALEITVPLEVELAGKDQLSISSKNMKGQAGAYGWGAVSVTMEGKLEEDKGWQGQFDVKDLSLTGLPVPVGLLRASGEWKLKGEALTIRFQGQDKTAQHHFSGSLILPLANPANGKLVVQKLQFPWSGGILTVNAPSVGLMLNRPVKATVTLQKIQLGSLLEQLGGKVSGTGIINGSLPVTWHPDGRIEVEDGTLEAAEEGLISVSPDALPGGDGEQMKIVSTALQYFHYTVMKIHLSSDKNEKTQVRLQVEGNNPEALDGRPVKLNVNLGGDVIPLVRQSLFPVSDPAELLRRQGKP